MTLFKKATIRRKVLITALILFFAVTIVKYFEVTLLDNLEFKLGSNNENNFKMLFLSKDLENSLNAYFSSISNYAISGNSKFLILSDDAEKRFKSDLTKLKSKKGLYEDNLQQLESLSNAVFTDVKKIIKNPIKLQIYLAGHNAQIVSLMFNSKEVVAFLYKSTDDYEKFSKESFTDIKKLYLITMLAVLLIILVTIIIEINLIIGPVSELVNGVKLIWAGDTEHRIQISTKDEIGELAKVFNQMAESIHREKKRLFEKATTDEMTGLFNFRYFQDTLDKEFENASRFNRTLSFIMMDVDFFKFYNDTNGHQAGDQVLKTVAFLVRSSCRDNDIPARYGGEEFVVILPNTPLDAALKVAERIRSSVESTEFMHQEKQPNKNLTLSLGVSNYPNNNCKTPKELVEIADNAMYISKSSGKNKVTVANTPN